MHKIVAHRRIRIWGLRSAWIKKLKTTDPNFFWKKMRVCFLQLFDLSTPKASNRDPTARDNFMGMKKIFLENHKIFITQPILVLFWSLRYLWKCLYKRILDLRLSLTYYGQIKVDDSKTLSTLLNPTNYGGWGCEWWWAFYHIY